MSVGALYDTDRVLLDWEAAVTLTARPWPSPAATEQVMEV
jgi:hypothetical protein